MAYVPRVVFDFDGVINSYRSGWCGAEHIPDPPVPGIREAIQELIDDGYAVVVSSSRASSEEGKAAIEEYLRKHDIRVTEVTSGKPPALCYVDDRAIRFDGDAAGLTAKIRGFKPWYERTDDDERKGERTGNI